MKSREKIVDTALSWFGTAYHHHARIKKNEHGLGGVDCAQFPIAVYSELELIPDVKPEYSEQWHLNSGDPNLSDEDKEIYLNWVRKFAKEIPIEEAQDGDFLVWKFGRRFSHGGILINKEQVIHALINIGVTITNIQEDSELNNRPVKAFTIF